MTTQHHELTTALDQAQATYDRKRAYVERCVRYLDDCPDGHPRKAEAEQRVQRALSDMHAAERAAGDAAEALMAYEDAQDKPRQEPMPPATKERLVQAIAEGLRQKNPGYLVSVERRPACAICGGVGVLDDHGTPCPNPIHHLPAEGGR